MKSTPLKFYVQKTAPFFDFFDIHAWRSEENGDVSIMEETQLQVLKKDDTLISCERNPFFKFTQDEAQNLMDALWDAGIRPVAGAGSSGQLAATQKHLDDMRHLAFKSTPKELK